VHGACGCVVGAQGLCELRGQSVHACVQHHLCVLYWIFRMSVCLVFRKQGTAAAEQLPPVLATGQPDVQAAVQCRWLFGVTEGLWLLCPCALQAHNQTCRSAQQSGGSVGWWTHVLLTCANISHL